MSPCGLEDDYDTEKNDEESLSLELLRVNTTLEEFRLNFLKLLLMI